MIYIEELLIDLLLKRQKSIETITEKAIPQLEDKSKPEDMEEDWITNFFDKCRIVSGEEMQSLWAKVLSGEANRPGSFSKRTVNFLGSLDKADALLFSTLCGFGWFLGGVLPLIYDESTPIYNDVGINFNSLTHLDDIGLIRFEPLSGFKRIGFPKQTVINYYGKPTIITFKKEENNDLEIGKVLLSKTGQQLAPICGSKPVEGFQDYVIEHWMKKDLVLSSPLPNNK